LHRRCLHASSDDRFAAFSLASGLSKSSDNGALPDIAAPCSAHPIQNFLPGTTVAIVGVVWAHGTPQGGGGNSNARLCVCGSRRLGRCRQVALRSRSAYAQAAVRPVIIVEPPSSKPLPTPPNVLPAKTRPAPTERYSKQSPTLGLVSYRHQSSTITPMR